MDTNVNKRKYLKFRYTFGLIPCAVHPTAFYLELISQPQENRFYYVHTNVNYHTSQT